MESDNSKSIMVCPIQYYCESSTLNRKNIFKEALEQAKNGKVLYITAEELTELPELSQDFSTANRKYMKMISFLYVKTLVSLLECLSSLPEWQNKPSTIIIDSLEEYCPKDKLQNATGVVALLVDTIHNSSMITGKLIISVNIEKVDSDYCLVLKELYPEC